MDILGSISAIIQYVRNCSTARIRDSHSPSSLPALPGSPATARGRLNSHWANVALCGPFIGFHPIETQHQPMGVDYIVHACFARPHLASGQSRAVF